MSTYTDSQWIEQFEIYLKYKFPGRTTAKHYASDIRIFIRALNKPITEIISTDISHFISYEYEHEMQPSTIKRRVAAVKTFFDFLIEENRVNSNPVSMKRHTIKLPKLLPRCLSDEEVKAFLSVVQDPRDLAIISVMLHGGLRVEEATGIHVSDIILPQDRQSPVKLRVIGKGRKERIAYLSPMGYEFLEQYISDHPSTNGNPVFCNHHGEPITVSGIQYRIRCYSKLSGVEVTPHRLRHTFSRWMAEGGVPLLVLSRLLGHKDPLTTQRYIDGADLQLKEHYEKAMSQPIRLEKSVPFPEIDLSVKATIIRPEPPIFDGKNWMIDFPQWLRNGCINWIKRCWFTWKPSQRKRNGEGYLYGLKAFWQWQLVHKSFSDWNDLTTKDIESFVQAQFDKGLKAKSIKTYLDRLYGLLNYLYENNELITIPRRPMIKLPDSLPRHLSPEELIKLDEYIDNLQIKAQPKDWLLIALYYLLTHGGLRISEVLDLQVRDIDFTTKRIKINQGKGRKDRIVYLTTKAAEAIISYLQTIPHAPEDILMSWKGKPLEYYQAKSLIQYLKKSVALKKLYARRFRHTFATHLLNNGMDIESLRRLMGHENLNTTLIYARLADITVEQHYRNIMEKVDLKSDSINSM